MPLMHIKKYVVYVQGEHIVDGPAPGRTRLTFERGGLTLDNPVPVRVRAKPGPGGAFKAAVGQVLLVQAEAVPQQARYCEVDTCAVIVKRFPGGEVVQEGEATVSEGRFLTYQAVGLPVGVFDVHFLTAGGSTTQAPSSPARLLIAPA